MQINGLRKIVREGYYNFFYICKQIMLYSVEMGILIQLVIQEKK